MTYALYKETNPNKSTQHQIRLFPLELDSPSRPARLREYFLLRHSKQSHCANFGLRPNIQPPLMVKCANTVRCVLTKKAGKEITPEDSAAVQAKLLEEIRDAHRPRVTGTHDSPHARNGAPTQAEPTRRYCA